MKALLTKRPFSAPPAFCTLSRFAPPGQPILGLCRRFWRPASESGRLRHGEGATKGGDRWPRGLKLAILWRPVSRRAK